MIQQPNNVPTSAAYTSARHRRRPRSALVRVAKTTLIVFWTLALALHQGVGAQSGVRQTTTFEVQSGEPPEPQSLRVLVQGQANPVVDIQPLAQSEVVIWVDLPLSTPEGLGASLSALAERADQLLALGPLHIVVADRTVETVLEPGGNARDVAFFLRRIAQQRARDAGTLLERRHELLQTLERETWQVDALTLLAEENEILTWQQDLLRAAFADRSPGRRGVLFMLRDGYDTDPLDLLRELKEPDPRFERRADFGAASGHRDLARTLSVQGWVTVPLRLGEVSGNEGEKDPLPGSQATLEDFSRAGGSRVVTNAAELDQELETLSRAYRVTWQSAQTIAEPTPIDLQATQPSGALADLRWRRWTTSVAPAGIARHRAQQIIDGFVASSGGTLADQRGDLDIEGVLLLGALGEEATLDAALDLASVPGLSAGAGMLVDATRFRLTLLTRGFDTGAKSHQTRGEGGIRATTGRWFHQTRFPVPADLDRAALVVEDLVTGAWGAVPVEVSTRPLARSGGVQRPPPPAGQPSDRLAVNNRSGSGDPGGPGASPDPSAKPAAGTTRPLGPAGLIELVPPRGDQLRGKVRFKVLLATAGVAAVRFELDGREVAIDERSPFGAEIDLGPSVAPHVVRAVAMSGGGLEMASDSYELNRPRQRTGVRITRLEQQPDGSIDTSAELTLEEGTRLDRVEFYRNQQLVLTLTQPPFRARLPATGAIGSDFVRVAAWLDDGAMLEDARLVGEDVASERIDVNLVQVFVVATDREGNPIDGLDASDFELKRGRATQEIERFSVADEVPLVLGLVVDTSGSMMPIMSDTQRAAARFISETLTDIDKGFLVDFDDRARLAHPVTGRLIDLVQALGGLEPDGNTALYDAIVFSLLQFEDAPGRRALVLLSDGDDYRSRFGWKRTWQNAKESTVPIYVIGLGGLDPERASFRKDDLEVIAKDSGGRVFYVESMDEVRAAYDIIGKELRSQYVLGFTTDGTLDGGALSRISVKSKKSGVKIRAVVGQSGQ